MPDKAEHFSAVCSVLLTQLDQLKVQLAHFQPNKRGYPKFGKHKDKEEVGSRSRLDYFAFNPTTGDHLIQGERKIKIKTWEGTKEEQ